MKAFHLLGFSHADGRRLVFQPRGGARLQLPASLTPTHQETLLAFFQQVLSERPLRRIEVAWDDSLLPSDQRLLEEQREHQGSAGALIVVRIRNAGADLRELERLPALRPFQFVALVCSQPALGEHIGVLRALAQLVQDAAQEHYQVLVPRLGLHPEGFERLRLFSQSFVDPVLVLAVLSALIEVQLNAPQASLDQVESRVFVNVLRPRVQACSAEQIIALCAHVSGELERGRELLAEQWPVELARLRAQGLLLNGTLISWAAFLARREVYEGVARELPTRAQDTAAWSEGVREALSWLRPATKDREEIAEQVYRILGLIHGGKLDEAERAVEGLKSEPMDDALRGDFLEAQGRLLTEQGRLPEAEPLFREALALKEQGGDSATSRGVALGELARCLQATGRDSEATPLFKRAIALFEADERPDLVEDTRDLMAQSDLAGE